MKLDISAKTVENHRTNLMRKLGVHDVAGVIRSLGESDAVIVGHGWGGLGAWSTAVLEPETVRAIVPVSMPHPRQRPAGSAHRILVLQQRRGTRGMRCS